LPGMALPPIIAAAMPPLNGFYRQAIFSPTHSLSSASVLRLTDFGLYQIS
jgi:hypothetical protein